MPIPVIHPHTSDLQTNNNAPISEHEDWGIASQHQNKRIKQQNITAKLLQSPNPQGLALSPLKNECILGGV
jgi:hypothetical protein